MFYQHLWRKMKHTDLDRQMRMKRWRWTDGFTGKHTQLSPRANHRVQ